MNHNEKNGLSYIAPVNFVLTVLVVFIHGYNASAYNLQYSNVADIVVLSIEDLISQNFARIAVPLFFAISGFLFYRTAEFSNLKNKLLRRTKTLLVPYLIWNTLYFIAFLLITNISFISQYLNSTETITFSLKSIISNVIFYENNYIMWFIYQLMIYTALCPLFIMLLKSKIASYAFLLILAGLYALNFTELPKLSSFSMASGIYPDQLFYYFLGAFFARRKPLFKKEHNKKIACIILILSQVIWLFNRAGYKEWRFNLLYLMFCAMSVYAILVLIFSSTAEFKNINESKILKLLMKSTFIIFAAHPFIIELVQKLFYILLPHNAFFALMDFIFSPLVSIAICVLAGSLINKISPRLYRILTGGR